MAHNPVPGRPVTVRYAEPDYWEARSQREPALFEWFFGYTALRRLIRTYISKKRQVLHIGCGTSNLQEGMARSGYSITNTDISEVVIKQMQQRHAQYSNMTYRVSDCRSMPEFMDCSFGHVLDKGTIDALLCCKQGTENVMRMLLEIYRVLQPGGSFMLVTLGDPTRRLPLLCDPRLPWTVSLLLLPKIQAANQAYVDGKAINDSTEPVEAQGPYQVMDANTILELPTDIQYTNFFFAYVCKKQPLQLSQHGDRQKGQLPNGWVAGSKELFQKIQKEMGLPEDLLDKGRRKRVMHVPAGQASMSVHPHMGPSSSASVVSLTSATSGNGSPQMYPALPGSFSSSSAVPAAAASPSVLQSALTVLQQQLGDGALQRHTPVSPAADELVVTDPGVAAGVGVPCEMPARSCSAPDLLALNAAAEAAAAAAATTAAAVMPAGLAVAASPVLELAGRSLELSAGEPGTSVSLGIVVPDGVVPAAAAASPAELAPHSPEAAEAGVSSLYWPRRQQGPPAAVSVHELPHEGDVNMQSPLSMPSPTTPGCEPPALLHSISSPARLLPAAACNQQQPDGQQQQQPLLSPDAQQLQQPAALQQVFNFGAPGTVCAPHNSMQQPAAAAEAAAGPVVSASLMEASPLPPMGKPKHAVVSTPSSLTGSPSHAGSGSNGGSSSQPMLPAFPGLSLQTGQILPELQGQQAAGAVSAATAAATAAGMYPHAAAPCSQRLPRLRRFSTEYGALSGSALQMQLEQLRLIQAQHSESAADGLVLHDVAAGDSCGTGAVAAAAAAAWGAVRKPRDRRLSNISVMSGFSIISSTSIDESGEDNLAFEAPSAIHTNVCSSEPSCVVWSPGRIEGVQESGSSSCGVLKGTSMPVSPLSSRASVEQALPEPAN